MSGEKAEGVDGRIPTWNGDWTTYSEYVLRCELKADSIKEEEKPLLGPRLAGNLTGRAFDCMVDIDRSQLRKEDGWRYLLEFLESKRGKEKVDVLGDMFTEFFLKKDSHRKDGEDLADYEPRFRQLVRRLDKAVAETGTQGKIPPELYGWFLLNVYMKMDASDMANVRGKADSYKLDDILTALKKMWSGGGLSLRDAERKKTRGSGTFVAEEVDSEGHQVFGAEDEEDGEDEDLQFAETTARYQESLEALLEEPEDVQILANFKEARRAVEQARNSRGFYPGRTQMPGTPDRALMVAVRVTGKAMGAVRKPRTQTRSAYAAERWGILLGTALRSRISEGTPARPPGARSLSPDWLSARPTGRLLWNC